MANINSSNGKVANLLFSLFCCLLSLTLFFSNPDLKNDFGGDAYGYFLEFSRSIFQANNAYYAESVLLPLLARLVRASQSIEAYQLLCALITISIIPICGLLILFRSKSILTSLIFICLFSFSFNYFRFYILGFSDPLTILLLTVAAFQVRCGPLFVFLVLAMLSHFSMAGLAAVGLAGLFYFSPQLKKQDRVRLALSCFLAVIAGRLLLATWYWLFEYNLVSRLGFIINKGFLFYSDQYQKNLEDFWLTPGSLFLSIYFFSLAYFICRRNIAFIFAALFSLAITYVGLFFTIDGLRIFSGLIAGPYVFLLAELVISISSQVKLMRYKRR